MNVKSQQPYTDLYEIHDLPLDSDCDYDTNQEIDNDNKSNIDDLDTEWLKEFEKYNDFYKEPVTTIEVVYVYISREKSLTDIRKRKFLLQNGCMKKEDLIYTIKENNHHRNRKYGVLSIIQYNYHIEQDDILNYLKETKQIHNQTYQSNTQKQNQILELNDEYLIYHNALNDIYFHPTITLFQQLNSLYIIYYERNIEKTKLNTTKKIHIQNIGKHKKKHNKTYKK